MAATTCSFRILSFDTPLPDYVSLPSSYEVRLEFGDQEFAEFTVPAGAHTRAGLCRRVAA